MTVPSAAGEGKVGNLTPMLADGGRARGEVSSDLGEGEGCGVSIRVANAFLGCGDRIIDGSDVIVNVSLESRE